MTPPMHSNHAPHELLHTTYLISDIFDKHVDFHTAGLGEISALATQISNDLGTLYQLLGGLINEREKND